MSLALVGGLVASCLPELPRGRSCGDGWWDPEYEQCDPTSSDRSYMAACRDHGLDKEATCDPTTCEVRASEQECSRCGDGVASGDEACDGDDLRGLTCPSGADALRCTDQCTLDFELCPAVCGDGIVDETEECDPALACFDDEACGPNRVCSPVLEQCVPDDGFGPNLDCSYYETTAIGFNKPYASGEIDLCTEHCDFGRNDCSFCGDGEVDDSYFDRVHPDGGNAMFPAEICDGDEVRVEALEAHCEPRCVPDEPIDADVVVLCAFDCNDDCDGFEQSVNPGDPDPSCCLAKGSPCPTMDSPGVPDLPCCSWAEHPEWSCVQGGLKPVCP